MGRRSRGRGRRRRGGGGEEGEKEREEGEGEKGEEERENTLSYTCGLGIYFSSYHEHITVFDNNWLLFHACV